jgi:hypothetical protein
MPTAPRVLAPAAAFVCVVLPVVALAEHPLGDVVPSGVLADVTTAGLGLIGALVSDVPPVPTPIAPFTSSDQTGCIAGNCAFSYDLSLSGLESTVDATSITLAPDEAAQALDIVGTGVASLNSAAAPGVLELDVVFAFVPVIDDTCQVWIEPVNLEITGSMELDVVPLPDGTSVIDTTVPPVAWSWDADGDDIVFTGCQLADVVNTVNDTLSLFGLDLYDILLDQLEPTIDVLVLDLGAEIEPVADELFAAFVVNEEIDVAGTPITVALWPDQVTVEDPDGAAPGGLRIGLASTLTATTDPCVTPYGVTGSPETPADGPAIGTAPGLAVTPSLAMLASDDFVDHFLFALWSTGLMCGEVSDGEELGIPFPLDTTLLDILAPGSFGSLFSEPVPLLIRLAPYAPPTLDLAGPNDVDLDVDRLGLDLIAEVDGRDARLLGIDLATTVALALPYDATTGVLTLQPSVGDVVGTVGYNEFDPSASTGIEVSLALLISLFLAPTLETALPPVDVPMPLLGEGIGVTEVATMSADASDTWLGLFAATGPVDPDYTSAGCGETGGCDESTYGAGCATGGVPGRLVFLVPLLAAGLRRQSGQRRRASSSG